ncbi:MAG: diaminopimelate epimerase [Candidatus Neoclostridium sp.]
MKLRFTKMQAAGNDYIYVRTGAEGLENASEIAKKLSRRSFSVGADGLVLIKPSRDCDAETEIYNADGSRARICGNALRCVAKYCFDRLGATGECVRIRTDGGVKEVERARLSGETRYFVRMGRVQFFERGGITLADIGNLHRVERVKEPDETDFFSLADFRPDEYNTEVYKVVGKNEAAARVFERGSGITLSCGSGATAIAAFGVKTGDFGLGEVKVIYPGGTLYVNVEKDGFCTLSGGAEWVFDGETEL